MRIRLRNPNYQPEVKRLPQADLDRITAAIAAIPQTVLFVDGVETNVRTILGTPGLSAETIFEGLHALGYDVERIA